MNYDIIIIGAGPAGYSLANLTAKNGLNTLIIEKDKPGGVCLNIGCIPTKALINISSTIDDFKKLNITDEEVNFTINRIKISQKVKTIADNVSKGIDYLFKTNNVEYINGEAEFVDKNTIKVLEKIYKAETIVIAAGSRNKDISNFYKTTINKDLILTSTEALFLNTIPAVITILGAGAIGVEFAFIFNNLGSKVNLVEYFPTILPGIDNECSRTLERSFRKKNINIITNAKITGVSQSDDELIVDYENNNKNVSIKSNYILNALGRSPNTNIKGIENLNIEMEKGFIKVDNNFESSVENIFAIGDIISNKPLLAHVAYDEARTLADIILKKKDAFKIDYSLVPYCIYTEPQIASFGIQEETAKEKGMDFKSIKLFFKASGKAMALEKSDGFIKIIIYKQTETVIGAHITGHDATEIIHELLLCAKSKIKIKDLAGTMHAHPTLSELIADTAKSYFDLNLH